eukprot:8683837-Alexandrium_andersonii.AAC.1
MDKLPAPPWGGSCSVRTYGEPTRTTLEREEPTTTPGNSSARRDPTPLNDTRVDGGAAATRRTQGCITCALMPDIARHWCPKNGDSQAGAEAL